MPKKEEEWVSNKSYVALFFGCPLRENDYIIDIIDQQLCRYADSVGHVSTNFLVVDSKLRVRRGAGPRRNSK